MRGKGEAVSMGDRTQLKSPRRMGGEGRAAMAVVMSWRKKALRSAMRFDPEWA